LCCVAYFAERRLDDGRYEVSYARYSELYEMTEAELAEDVRAGTLRFLP